MGKRLTADVKDMYIILVTCILFFLVFVVPRRAEEAFDEAYDEDGADGPVNG